MGAFQGANISLFHVDLGRSANQDVEQEIFEEIGSYGHQLGRLGDVSSVSR